MDKTIKQMFHNYDQITKHLLTVHVFHLDIHTVACAHEYWAWSNLTRQSGSLNMTGNVSHDGLSMSERGNTWWEWRHCQRTQTAELESPDWSPVAARDGAMLPTNNKRVITDYYLIPTWPGPPPPVPTRSDDRSDTASLQQGTFGTTAVLDEVDLVL